MIAACTVISPNYLPFARTLAASYLRHHPGHWFFVLIVADLPDVSLFLGERFEAVALAEIGLADVRGEAMKYDILEQRMGRNASTSACAAVQVPVCVKYAAQFESETKFLPAVPIYIAGC